LNSGQENTSADLSRIAATLYMEMKKSINTKNLNSFREAITVAKEIMQRSRQRQIVERLASLKDDKGRNVLHDAALLAVKADDARYFNELVALGIPFYEEDKQGYFAAFYIS